MKTTKIIITLLLMISLFSCNKESVIETIEKNNTNNSDLKLSVYDVDTTKVYHFITYDIKNFQKNKQFIKRIRKLVKVKGGKILTKGIKGDCVERECSEVNFVIEFASRSIGESFFSRYEKNLSRLSKKATKKLSYIITSSETIPSAVFNEDITTRAYAIIKINVTDPVALNENYNAQARNILIDSNGNYLVLDPTQQCRIGECPNVMALIGFESKKALRDWYYREDYQEIIPFRLAATTGGGIFLTK